MIERAGCITLHLFAFLMLYGCLCSGSPPRGAIGWSVIMAFPGHTAKLIYKLCIFRIQNYMYSLLVSNNIKRLKNVIKNKFKAEVRADKPIDRKQRYIEDIYFLR